MKIRLTSRAHRDLADIADYLNARNPHAARRVADRISRSLQILQRSPELGRASGVADLRQYTIPRFPYLILYRLAADTIEVITIFHTSRNPNEKRL